MIDVERIRRDFPILEGIVYLDSAATAQRPKQVVDAVDEFYRNKNSNVARGLYPLAEEATLAFEEVRKKAMKFINARNGKEIIFTKNTTESMNLVMRGWGEKFVKPGDKIVTSVMEHHSNFVPWQHLAKSKRARFEVMDINNGQIEESEIERTINGAKLVAICSASNVIGTLNDTKRICKIAHDNDAICVVDGAQSAPSIATDVHSIGCDFLAFSGHKMLAPFGVGVLYGKEDLLESMDPFMYGSEMIRTVSEKKTEWNELPYKFEPGTPDVGAVIGLGAAIDYLSAIGLDNIRSHEYELISYMMLRLSEVKGLAILGTRDTRKRGALVAFTVEGVHPHDVSAMLADDGICVRSGHHCAMPLHERLSIPASTRASVYLYNKKDEIDALAESLIRIKKVFG